MECHVPRPLKAGESHNIEVEFDATGIPAGLQILSWQNINVYSNSEGTVDVEKANNRSMYMYLAMNTSCHVDYS